MAASNFIHVPRGMKSASTPSRASLGLTGRIAYVELRPLLPRHFTVHIDVTSTAHGVLRLSFSNMFKKFKLLGNCAQIPLRLRPVWTVLAIDLPRTMEDVTDGAMPRATFASVKGFQLCSNALVRGVFTSDFVYAPETLPREMAFPDPKEGQAWTQAYDFFWVPQEPVVVEQPYSGSGSDGAAAAAGGASDTPKDPKRHDEVLTARKHGAKVPTDRKYPDARPSRTKGAGRGAKAAKKPTSRAQKRHFAQGSTLGDKNLAAALSATQSLAAAAADGTEPSLGKEDAAALDRAATLLRQYGKIGGGAGVASGTGAQPRPVSAGGTGRRRAPPHGPRPRSAVAARAAKEKKAAIRSAAVGKGASATSKSRKRRARPAGSNANAADLHTPSPAAEAAAAETAPPDPPGPVGRNKSAFPESSGIAMAELMDEADAGEDDDELLYTRPTSIRGQRAAVGELPRPRPEIPPETDPAAVVEHARSLPGRAAVEAQMRAERRTVISQADDLLRRAGVEPVEGDDESDDDAAGDEAYDEPGFEGPGVMPSEIATSSAAMLEQSGALASPAKRSTLHQPGVRSSGGDSKTMPAAQDTNVGDELEEHGDGEFAPRLSDQARAHAETLAKAKAHSLHRYRDGVPLGPSSPAREPDAAADAVVPSGTGDDGVETSVAILRPDPIMKLRGVIGMSGKQPGSILWSADGTQLVFPCASIIVAMSLLEDPGRDSAAAPRPRKQRHFLGHTRDVSSIALSRGGTRMASAQTGVSPTVRVWDFEHTRCLALLSEHAGGVDSLSFSDDDKLLVAHGHDARNRVLLIVWNIARVATGHHPVVARQVSDFPISRIRFSPYDLTRLVSCGRENIRFWRVKRRCLPGCPVILNQYARNCSFTDLAFESGYGARAIENEAQRRVFVAADNGTVLQVNYETRVLECVFRLHDGAISSIAVNEGFCVTGAADNYLRVWPLDFSDYFLEAQHEGPVTSASISPDGLKIAIGTAHGTLGALDVSTHAYHTLLRAHSDEIKAVAVRPATLVGDDGSVDVTVPDLPLSGGGRAPLGSREATTVSSDGTVRVWSLESWDQMYEFDAPGETAVCVCYHPTQHVIACGFESGAVRVFHIPSTSMLEEYVQHRAAVRAIVFTPDGSMMFSAGADGHVCIYDPERGYSPIKVLSSDFPGDTISPSVAMSMSPDGAMLALAFAPPDLSKQPHDLPVPAASGCVLVLEPRSLAPVFKLRLPRGGDAWAKPRKGRTVPVPTRRATSGGTAEGTALDRGPEHGTHDDFGISVAPVSSGTAPGTRTVSAVPLRPGGDEGETNTSPRSAAGRRKVESVVADKAGGTGSDRNGHVASLIFSPDSRSLLATTDDWRVCIWDAATGILSKEVRGVHRSRVGCSAVTTNGVYLATGGDDRVIKIWDFAMRGPPPPLYQAFVGHSDAITDVAFTNDGRQLMSIGGGAALFVWDFLGEAVRGPAEPDATAVAIARTRELAGEILAPVHDGGGGGRGSAAEGNRKSASSPRTPAQSLVDIVTSERPDEPVTGPEVARRQTIRKETGHAAEETDAPRSLSHSQSRTDLHKPPPPVAVDEEGSADSGDAEQVERDLARSGAFGAEASEFADIVGAAEGVLVAAEDGTAVVDSTRELAMARVLGLQAQCAGGVVWVPQSKLFAYCAGRNVVVEDLLRRTHTLLSALSSPLATLAVAPHGRLIAATAQDVDAFGRAPVSVWRKVNSRARPDDDDVEDAQPRTSRWRHMGLLSYHDRPIASTGFSADGRYLTSVSTGAEGELSDGTPCVVVDVAVWAIDTGSVAATAAMTLPLPSNAAQRASIAHPVNNVRWSPTSRTPKAREAPDAAAAPPPALVFATGGWATAVWRFSAADSSLVYEIVLEADDADGADDEIGDVFTSIAWRRPVAAAGSGPLRLAKPSNRKPGAAPPPMLAVGSAAGTVSLLTITDEAPVLATFFTASVELGGEDGDGTEPSGLTALEWRGDVLVGGCVDGVLLAWDVSAAVSAAASGSLPVDTSAVELCGTSVVDTPVMAMAWDAVCAEGVVLVTGGSIWRVQWGQVPCRLAASHTAAVSALTTSSPVNVAPGRRSSALVLSAGGDDGSVRVWDSETWDQVVQFAVETDGSVAANCIAVSAQREGSGAPTDSDPQWAAVGTSSGDVRLFRLDSVRAMARLQLHATSVTHVAWACGGAVLVSSDAEGNVHLTLLPDGAVDADSEESGALLKKSTVYSIVDLSVASGDAGRTHLGHPVTSLDVSAIDQSLICVTTSNRRTTVWRVHRLDSTLSLQLLTALVLPSPARSGVSVSGAELGEEGSDTEWVAVAPAEDTTTTVVPPPPPPEPLPSPEADTADDDGPFAVVAASRQACFARFSPNHVTVLLVVAPVPGGNSGGDGDSSPASQLLFFDFHTSTVLRRVLMSEIVICLRAATLLYTPQQLPGNDGGESDADGDEESEPVSRMVIGVSTSHRRVLTFSAAGAVEAIVPPLAERVVDVCFVAQNRALGDIGDAALTMVTASGAQLNVWPDAA